MGTVNTTVERIVYEGVDMLSAASAAATKGAEGLRKSLDQVKTVLAAVGVTVGAGAFVSLYLDSLKATAALDDMAEATGSSVEGLSAIQRVAKVGGHDFEGLTAQLGKMIKGLRDGDEEGSKTAAALDHLGIKARDNTGQWRDMSAVLVELAQKLKGTADDGARVLLVEDALGKGAGRYIPLLKDIADGTDLHATVTRKQAEEAEAAEKNINRLKLSLEDTRRELVSQATPAIIDISNEMVRAAREGGILRGVWEGLKKAAQFGAGVGSEQQELDGVLRSIRERYEAIAKIDRDLQAGRLRGSALGTAPYHRRQLFDEIAELEQTRNRLASVLAIGIGASEASAETPPGERLAPAPSVGYGGMDRARLARERDFIAKQMQEGAEEERRIQLEAWQWTAFYRNKQLETEKETEDARLKAMQDFTDRAEALEIEEGAILMGTQRRDWLKGMDDAFDSYIVHATNAAEQSAMLFGNAFRNMEDALVRFAMTGKVEFRSFAESVIADLIRIQIRNEMAGFLGASGLRGLFGGSAGTSSSLGEYVPGSVPQYAHGTDYVPRTGLALVHQGERITPASQNRGGAPAVYQTFHLGGEVTRAEVAAVGAAARNGAIAAIIEMKRRDPSGPLS